eukprot:m51a1_g9031 hypothetical protein (350) ;mRNA; r:227159-228636
MDELRELGPLILESNRQRALGDIRDLLYHNGSLQARQDVYVDAAGKEHRVVGLVGTVVMRYQGASYNIPIHIYILRDYPSSAPRCYVRPCKNMVINRAHPTVDPNGDCAALPCLRQWNPRCSTLLGLSEALSREFSAHPPLYSVSTSPEPPPHHGVSPQLTSSGGSLTGSQRRTSLRDMPASARMRVEELARKRLAEVSSDYGQMLEAAYETQRSLAANESLIARAAAQLTNATRGAVDSEALARARTAEIESWVSTVEKMDLESSRTASADADAVVAATTPLGVQLLRAVAEDAVLEDTMYVISRNINGETMDDDLRAMRKLAEEQFVARATAAKISVIYRASMPLPL